MIGEAEFAVAPLLWNRIRELSRADPQRGLRERCRDFSMAAGLDAEVARQWSLAREVENALWYACEATPRGRPRPFALGGQHARRPDAPGASRAARTAGTGGSSARREPSAVARARTAARASRTASTATATSASSVLQLLTEIRRMSRSCQREPDIQTRPSAMIRAVTARVVASSPKASETWV